MLFIVSTRLRLCYEAGDIGNLEPSVLTPSVVLLASPALLETSVPLDPKLDLSSSMSAFAV
jgi:hypothetical protein